MEEKKQQKIPPIVRKFVGADKEALIDVQLRLLQIGQNPKAEAKKGKKAA